MRRAGEESKSQIENRRGESPKPAGRRAGSGEAGRWFGVVFMVATVFICGGCRQPERRYTALYMYVIERGDFPVFLRDFVENIFGQRRKVARSKRE